MSLQVLTDIGLHSMDQGENNPETNTKVSRSQFIYQESCRRLYFVIYIIELLAAVFTQRSITLQDNEVKIFLPVADVDFDQVTLDNYQYRGTPKPPKLIASGLLINSFMHSCIIRLLGLGRSLKHESQYHRRIWVPRARHVGVR